MKHHSILYVQRKTLGLTQKQVAARARITLQHYQKFERGERSILTCSFDLACRVIRTLDMDITEFYDGRYALYKETYIAVDEIPHDKKSLDDDFFKAKTPAAKKEMPTPKIAESTGLSVLCISNGVRNVLLRTGMEKVSDILNLKNREDLLRIRSMGPNRLNELLYVLEHAGFDVDHLRN